MKHVLLAASFAVIPAMAAADYISGDGHQYLLTCNADGLVLASKHPVSRWHGQGAMTDVTTATEVLYLGQSCDAGHDVYGEGRWMWGNGGFAVEFDTYRIGFPRQELNCPDQRNLPVCNGS